jgi:hypothetical protein
VPAQHRAGLADRPPDAGLQDLANCRKNNGEAIRKLAASSWCCAGALNRSARVAVDGSKFKGRQQARAAIGSEAVEAVADRGYCSGEEIVACEQAGITVAVNTCTFS